MPTPCSIWQPNGGRFLTWYLNSRQRSLIPRLLISRTTLYQAMLPTIPAQIQVSRNFLSNIPRRMQAKIHPISNIKKRRRKIVNQYASIFLIRDQSSSLPSHYLNYAFTNFDLPALIKQHLPNSWTQLSPPTLRMSANSGDDS